MCDVYGGGVLVVVVLVTMIPAATPLHFTWTSCNLQSERTIIVIHFYEELS